MPRCKVQGALFRIYTCAYSILRLHGGINFTLLYFLSGENTDIEYGSEVWEGNKSQAGSLESIILDGAKPDPWVFF